MPYIMDHEIDARYPTHELVNMIRRRRWVVLGFLLVGIIIGGILVLSRRASYESEVVIRVDEKEVGLPSLEARIPFVTGNRVGAEQEVLSSRTLAGMVVDALQLQLQLTSPRGMTRSRVFAAIQIAPEAPSGDYRLVSQRDGRVRVQSSNGSTVGTFAKTQPIVLPGVRLVPAGGLPSTLDVSIHVATRDEAVQTLTETLKARPTSDESGILHVSFKGPDPELVRDVPNELARQFIALRQTTHQAETRSTIAYLRGQLDTMAIQLSATESQLRSFREKEGVIDLPAERNVEINRLANLQAERDAMDSERAALARLVADVQANPAKPGQRSPFRSLVSFPSLLKNQAAAELVRSLVHVEDERWALVTRRTPSDPEMQALDAQIRDLEGSLQSTVMTYLSGLSNQVQEIDRQMGSYQQNLAGIPGKEVTFARLSRQAALQETIYGQLQTRLTEAEVMHAMQDASVRVVDPAVAILEPIRLKQALTMFFAVSFALLLGLALAFVLEYFDGSVRSRQDLAYATGLPVLGQIPQIRLTAGAGGRARRLQAYTSDFDEALSGTSAYRPNGDFITPRPELLLARGAAPHVSDAYQRLFVNMIWSAQDRKVRAVLFTSPLPGEGKTTTAINFSAALARRGQRVLLVDADLRRQTLSRRLHANGELGYANLVSACPPPAYETVHTLDMGNGETLHYIPAGEAPADQSELPDGDKIQALVTWAKSEYDVVVFDTPATTMAGDALFLSSWMDGVIFVARASVTPSEVLTQNIEAFRNASAPILGTVLNDVRVDGGQDRDMSYRFYGNGSEFTSAGASEYGAL